MEAAVFGVTRRELLAMLSAAAGTKLAPAWASELGEIPPQPYFAAVGRALEALTSLGAPIPAADAQQLAALARQGDGTAIDAAEKILDRYTLAEIQIEADGYARTQAGAAQRTLIEQGWRMFLVRVLNRPGRVDALHILGGLTGAFFAGPITSTSTGSSRAKVLDRLNEAPTIAEKWLVSQIYEASPMRRGLSGFPIEYGIVQLYSRDRGRHAAMFDFYTDPDQYAPFRAVQKYQGIKLDFDCLPSRDVILRVLDMDGRGCVAALTIKDKLDRVYPLQAMRLAPDLPFQAHIYRGDGETVRLPDGEYSIVSRRGPEYVHVKQTAAIGDGPAQIEIRLKRWIDPRKWGWYAGDPHIHAAGCSHYERPTEGVSPETMIRHVRGEGLSIGSVLNWGPSWYYQKQFFTGHSTSPPSALEHPELQVANNASLQPHVTPTDVESLLRYDVEVSGFPSSHCGHIALLLLKETDYPGTKIIQDWPSWNLPVLRWAREQGAVVGYTHCGLGLAVNSTELPNYEIPPMDSIGAQEAIVDVTYGQVDFLAGCNTHPLAELNAWYHMLNCGYRLALVGETDFPCVDDERPGMGRTYVRLKQQPVDDAGYEAWVHNMRKGMLYCGDGRSHFLDFKVNGRRSGEADLTLGTAGEITIDALVAARLEAQPENIHARSRATVMNGWHLEKARIATTREVPVELVVNGVAVAKNRLIADGTPRSIKFKTTLSRSAWIALRILPSSHTYPVFAQAAGKPIRASRRSAQWCRACVDKVWETKSPFMRENERPAAAEAFDHARRTYEAIAAECEVD